MKREDENIEVKTKNNSKKKIPVLSFFTGGGFLDMGFEQAGFKVVWTNEANEIFADLYEKAFVGWRRAKKKQGKSRISFRGSIEDIDPAQVLNDAFPKGVPVKFGVIGGPPCQDFSAAGNNSGFDGPRGRLTKVFFEYLEALSPSFFVVENVRNLAGKRHRKELKKALKPLREKYHIDQKILNAINYGVPQDRTRLFIVGIRKSTPGSILEQEFHFPWPVDDQYEGALTRFDWPFRDAFQNGVVRPDGIPKELYVESCLLSKRQEKEVPNGLDYFKPHAMDKFRTIEEGNTQNRSFKRLHRYRYSPTACYGNNEVHLHPFLPRRLSVRETLRIQSVPDTYILPSQYGLSNMFKLIGNGVPVRLAKEVATSVSIYLRHSEK